MAFNPADFDESFTKEDYEEFREIWDAVEGFYASRDDDDFEVNPPQFNIFIRVLTTIWDLLDEDDRVIEETRLIPKECVGGLTISFELLWVKREQIARLTDVLSDACAISLHATTDGRVVLSLNVPDVFRKKAGK